MKILEPLPGDRVRLHNGYRARVKRMIRYEISRYLIEVETIGRPRMYVYVSVHYRWRTWVERRTIIHQRTHHAKEA
jgi:hypothetical protein